MYPVPQTPYRDLPFAHVDTEAFLARVYSWMALGLAATGFTAMAVGASPFLQHLIFGTPVFWALIIAQFVMVMAFTPLVRRLSPLAAGGVFVLYAALSGCTLGSIFLIYTASSIAGTFFATAGAFGALSAYGLLTKRSLASWGSFLFMGLVGIVIASVVNLFLGSAPLGWVISCAGVLVFTGLIAYDTQRLKDLAGYTGESGAIQGALMLYLDFINLFLFVLRLFGNRRRD